jgi:hypothetical protein
VDCGLRRQIKGSRDYQVGKDAHFSVRPNKIFYDNLSQGAVKPGSFASDFGRWS